MRRPWASRWWRPLIPPLALCALVEALCVAAQPAPPESPVARVVRIHAEAQARFQRETGSLAAAWQLGRACFDLAELATNNTQRSEVATQGIEACRLAVGRDPKSAAAHYYLGLNLGQLARTKKLSALHLLKEIEAAWTATLGLDPQLDYAGAHRSLGVLYRDAPGWPVSLGSRKKARQHLAKALELSPQYPDNQLYWLETLLDWGEKKAVQSKIAPAEAVLAAARQQLTGEEWVLSWQDWDHRWQKIKARATSTSLKSPRDRE